ncbi:hypothetical protein PLICRDRAFT_175099 [Plicaturopsis crispa FD-325 SS-3]|nr:hypothetical protein PLICRDRAFT_175099 [Plicaturopsis crispa FD-325 SS-3]
MDTTPQDGSIPQSNSPQTPCLPRISTDLAGRPQVNLNSPLTRPTVPDSLDDLRIQPLGPAKGSPRSLSFVDAAVSVNPFVNNGPRNSRQTSPAIRTPSQGSSEEQRSQHSVEVVDTQLRPETLPPLSSFDDLETYEPLFRGRGLLIDIFDEPLQATIYRCFSDEISPEVIPTKLLVDVSGWLIEREEKLEELYYDALLRLHICHPDVQYPTLWEAATHVAEQRLDLKDVEKLPGGSLDLKWGLRLSQLQLLAHIVLALNQSSQALGIILNLDSPYMADPQYKFLSILEESPSIPDLEMAHQLLCTHIRFAVRHLTRYVGRLRRMDDMPDSPVSSTMSLRKDFERASSKTSMAMMADDEQYQDSLTPQQRSALKDYMGKRAPSSSAGPEVSSNASVRPRDSPPHLAGSAAPTEGEKPKATPAPNRITKITEAQPPRTTQRRVTRFSMHPGWDHPPPDLKTNVQGNATLNNVTGFLGWEPNYSYWSSEIRVISTPESKRCLTGSAVGDPRRAMMCKEATPTEANPSGTEHAQASL